MQFHDNGYVSGDPRREPAAGPERPERLPDQVDVLIVGAGPAGMTAFAQLAQFPSVVTRLIERRPGRLEIGQADGLQARSVESFQAFGFANRLIEEAYRIYSMAFWRPDPARPAEIVRTKLVPDDPSGISEFPHLILNQARVLDYFAEFAHNSPTRAVPDYGVEFLGLEVTDDAVLVQVREAGVTRTVRAKYVLGCDGARSQVREAIGRKLVGQAAMHAWGVMDVLARTDFPDYRTKCVIQSHDGGNILLIPREGGFLTRFYVDLGEVAEDDDGQVRTTPLESVVARANKILHPYTIEVQDVPWWSVYEVGHRLTDRFDDVAHDPKVFITGDACHTHSAKAGQGMNVSIQDGWNIAWKLGHVLEGRAQESLLQTYSAERQVVAQNLIAFDKEWSTLMATPAEQMPDPSLLETFYVQTFEFPAGFMTQYEPSVLTAENTHQDLALGCPIGKRFKSAIVHRVSDTTPIHLGHHARADGRWRIYVFADESRPGSGAAHQFAGWLADDPASPVRAHTPQHLDLDAWFDVKIVYQQQFGEIDLRRVPAVFKPDRGRFRITDWEKVHATGEEHDIFTERRISRDGALVVVRPDQYVANVLPLTAHDELSAFFAGIFA
ncbi:phenol 2-monooxygenase [Kineosporia sp. NBRC 101677]|uniref:FAD-dependent monooxygenase n=1 Tax=Kineosporia sp. NBRC 101677 TaxID=3032197 RepID=UPI0024A04487|nr:FAD-dependent monooxygenase [Kineosporia sp. NBRC 101677]GLY19521.1 phenol 2-monooxygenase [Kineosporia sp. NBRC 101677]